MFPSDTKWLIGILFVKKQFNRNKVLYTFIIHLFWGVITLFNFWECFFDIEFVLINWFTLFVLNQHIFERMFTRKLVHIGFSDNKDNKYFLIIEHLYFKDSSLIRQLKNLSKIIIFFNLPAHFVCIFVVFFFNFGIYSFVFNVFKTCVVKTAIWSSNQ